MSQDDSDLLNDMLERVHLTAEFVQGGRDTFMQSRLIQEAVTRNLEVIGEAARGVSDTLPERYPVLPWREIAAFRNFAISCVLGAETGTCVADCPTRPAASTNANRVHSA